MSDLVEKVARALCIEHACDPDNELPSGRDVFRDKDGSVQILPKRSGPQWRIFEGDARAAIAVVLKEMIKEMPGEENEANSTWFVRYFARENGIEL